MKIRLHTNKAVSSRDMRSFSGRTSDLAHISLIPEVGYALEAWRNAFPASAKVPGILIGGLALSIYTRPRSTSDVDLLFLDSTSIPEVVPGFKRIRPGSFQDNKNHVEVEVVPCSAINVSRQVAEKVINSAIVHDKLRIASPEGLVTLKLISACNNKRRLLKDSADIFALLDEVAHLDMQPWIPLLNKEEIDLLEEIKAKVVEANR